MSPDIERSRIGVFYSYSHRDEAFCEQLVDSLKPLEDEGVISRWYDRRIKPGMDWASAIDRNLDLAKIVLLLLSPDFLKSQYCMGIEFSRAIERHWQRRCRIIPIIVRPCGWEKTEIHSFQALPENAKPVSKWSDRGDALSSIVDGVREACRDVVDWENPYRRASIGDWTESRMTVLDRRTGQEVTFDVRLKVVTKSKKQAVVDSTVKMGGKIQAAIPTIGSEGAVQLAPGYVTIPLDQPLEDNLGQYMRQISVHLPSHVSAERDETVHDEQKLLIGGKAYYCQRTGYKVTLSSDLQQLNCTGMTWRCIDVPLDGIVRFEQETPVNRTVGVIRGYGWASEHRVDLREMARRVPQGRTVRILDLIKRARQDVDNDDFLVCPVCDASIKAINIEYHFRGKHGDLTTAELNSARLARETPKPKLDEELLQRRESIKRLARSVDATELVVCPECGTEMKASNLVRHFDKQHL